MSVYIHGLDMPTAEQGLRTINIYADGVVTNYAEVTIGTAVLLPDHGALIDKGALIEAIARIVPLAIIDPTKSTFLDGLSAVYEAIKATPTIIPADKEGK